jgi:hypothetical protein
LSSLTLGFTLAIPNNYVEPQLSSAPVAEAHPVLRPPGPRVSVWEVARLKVVSPAIDGPNVALVIRFEREARSGSRAGWATQIGASPQRCIGLFESVDTPRDDTGVGRAPRDTVAL